MIHFVFTVVLLLLSSPIFFIISVCVVLFEGFPIIFHQSRIGKNGRAFEIYKFRTMVIGSEAQKKHLVKYNEADGPVFKIKNDPRFTRVGLFLAHTGLDELPQLWNVIKGDMALIGPRPLPIDEARRLRKWQQVRHSIVPGIISPWIIHGYHSMSFDAWMKSDIEYKSQKSFFYDSRLFFSVLILFLRMFVQELQASFNHSYRPRA